MLEMLILMDKVKINVSNLERFKVLLAIYHKDKNILY